MVNINLLQVSSACFGAFPIKEDCLKTSAQLELVGNLMINDRLANRDQNVNTFCVWFEREDREA